VTSHDNRSTFSAKPRSANPRDVVLGAIVRSVVDAAAQAGLPRAALIERIGLRPENLENPDELVPFEAYVAVWEVVAQTPGYAELGLALGARSLPRFLGALGYAMVHAENALAAIALFQRFRLLVSDTLAPEIEFDAQHVTFHLAWPERAARLVPFVDSALVGNVAFLRALTGMPDTARLAVEAWYQCERPDGVDRADVLGCPVRYSAPEMRLVLLREPLEQPLPRHDPALFAYLERHAEAVLARLPADDARVSNRVRRLVIERLKSGEPNQAEISRKLAMSERTLQRRLREEGTTFAELLDGLRRELAERYLNEAEVGIHEVAFLLGYSEPSAFHRAFRRWTGTTPQGFRRGRA
jgi:AraC-like DNA-binding protein